jgi:hypothetical protein
MFYALTTVHGAGASPKTFGSSSSKMLRVLRLRNTAQDYTGTGTIARVTPNRAVLWTREWIHKTIYPGQCSAVG